MELSRRKCLACSLGVAVTVGGCLDEESDDNEADEPTTSDQDIDGPTPDGTWPTRFGNVGNTKSIDNSGPTGDLQVEWTAEPVGEIATQPILADGTVYCTTTIPDDVDPEQLPSGEVYAFDADDGNKKWSTEIAQPGMTSPVYADGVVYARGDTSIVGDTTIHAFDAQDGEVLWEDSVDGTAAPVAMTMYNGILFLPGGNGLTAFDTASREVVWDYSLEIGHVAVEDELVYFRRDDRIVALDAKTGEEVWQYNSTEEGLPMGVDITIDPIVANGSVYIIGNDQTPSSSNVGNPNAVILSVDASDGSFEWSSEVQYRLGDPPTVIDGTVYYQTEYIMKCPEQENPRESVFNCSGPVTLTSYFGAIDTDNGEHEWENSHSLRGDYDDLTWEFEELLGGPNAAANGIYCGTSGSDGVIQIDRDGDLSTHLDRQQTPPALGNESLYFGGENLTKISGPT